MTSFRKAAAFISATVVAHAIVVLLHARAHGSLAISMSGLQNAYIGLVIMAAPVVAGVLVWTPYRRAGALIFTVSMFGALAFGASYHFLASGIDNVSGVPPHGEGALFRLTAVLLAILEAGGGIIGWWSYRLMPSGSGDRGSVSR